jgi:hypothetical protein
MPFRAVWLNVGRTKDNPFVEFIGFLVEFIIRIENVLAYQAISGFLVEGNGVLSTRKAKPMTSGAGLPFLFVVPTVGTSPRGKRKVKSDAGKCFHVGPLNQKPGGTKRKVAFVGDD